MAEKRSDVEIVRDQMTREVTNDAYSVAQDVFRRPEPDVRRVSNQQIDDRYRRAFMEQDRAYLIAEAQRDPKQFLEAANRLGVIMPPDKPLEQEPPLPRQAQGAAPLPQLPAPAMPAQQPFQPVTPPVAVPATQLPAPPPPTVQPPSY